MLSRSKLLPDFMFSKVWEITPDFLKKHSINALIVDLDNTLAKSDFPDPWPGVDEWLELMQRHNIKIIILSNNSRKRIAPFANRYKYDFISMAAKPLSINFHRAILRLHENKRNVAMVGDQIFTDVWGANKAGLKTILVEPFEVQNEGGYFFRLKRKAETKYITKFKEGRK